MASPPSPHQQQRWTIYVCPDHGIHENSPINNWCPECNQARGGDSIRLVPAEVADRLAEALRRAYDELMMVGVGYRARPMPAEDYVLVEAAMAALRAALSAPEGEDDHDFADGFIGQEPVARLERVPAKHDRTVEAVESAKRARREPVEQQPDQVERGRALLKDGRLGAEFDVVPRSGSVGEDQRLTPEQAASLLAATKHAPAGGDPLLDEAEEVLRRLSGADQDG